MLDYIGTRAGAYGRWLASCLRVAAVSVLAVPGCMPAYAGDEVFHDKLISLGTASQSGSYHWVGTAMCDAVNQERRTSLIRCVPYNTVGAEYNSKAVAYGELTMGFTSTYIAHAEFMQKKSHDTRGADLRAVIPLYATPVMVIARRDAHIANATQLAGHSINIGNRGSGQRTVAEMLLKSIGLTAADFSAVTELNVTLEGEAFCQGKIDVIVESLGNPSPFCKKMIEKCNGVIVTFPPEMTDRILAANPLLNRMTIPGGLYAGYAQPVPSFGYRALLVTRAEVSDEAVRRFVASVMNALPDLKQSNPELKELDPDKMFGENIPIPLHQGVINYLNSKKTTSSHVDFTSR